MKKLLFPVVVLASITVYSCGSASEEAQKMIDSLAKDSAAKAMVKQDSIRMEDSIKSATKKMADDFRADSTRRADSAAKAPKK